MKFIEGTDPRQSAVFPVSLDERISADNEVRAIDAFVSSLDLEKLGFRVHFSEGGRPAYHPALLLKLYIYGYMNRMRSSRVLERECSRNIELMWLLHSLAPDHNTIANFRKNNPEAIKRVFRATVELAKNHDLIGGRLLAGDGTKLRAQNSKKNNYNHKKIKRHLGYIDNKLEEYNKALAQADGDDEKQAIDDEINNHKGRRKGYEKLQQQLDESGQDQISTSDPESRHMIIRGNITEVAYNIQSTVDAKNNLPIDYEVTNANDRNAMASMVENAIDILGQNHFEVLFDKGYHNAEQIHKCHEMGIETHVAISAPSSNAPDTNYNLNKFVYQPETDTYICPQKNTLKSNGNWYLKRTYHVKQYKTRACKNCPVKALCTKAVGQRIIERHQYAENLDRNRIAIEENPNLYKQRQAIVEHPFGTIKRQWGFDHILTKKGKRRASSDVGFIFIAYNLKRIWKIIAQNTSILLHIYSKSTLFDLFSGFYSSFSTFLRKSKPTISLSYLSTEKLNWQSGY